MSVPCPAMIPSLQSFHPRKRNARSRHRLRSASPHQNPSPMAHQFLRPYPHSRRPLLEIPARRVPFPFLANALVCMRQEFKCAPLCPSTVAAPATPLSSAPITAVLSPAIDVRVPLPPHMQQGIPSPFVSHLLYHANSVALGATSPAYPSASTLALSLAIQVTVLHAQSPSS
mmetsp:Transcript_32563/g.52760  ORF Transcript_32563/g.52760 Transcript_32563/m.52760 type:complete len:172 (-) Transcript_32563:1018-1533(-)